MNKPTLNITFKVSESETFPLYHQYSLQQMPQPAFITLDLEDGECTADWASEIGSVPANVFHNRLLRFPVSSSISAANILELINKYKEDLQKILNGSSVEWDGNNHSGVFTDETNELIENVKRSIEDDSNDLSVIVIDNSGDLEEFLDGEIYPESGCSVEEFATLTITSIICTENYGISDKLNNVDTMASYLSDLWAEKLYSDLELPKHVAQYLIDNHVCDDSAWMEELTAMANK